MSGAITSVVIACAVTVAAQPRQANTLQVSITRTQMGAQRDSTQFSPDGTTKYLGVPLEFLVASAVPPEASEIEGLPGWARLERYDVVVRPPANSTPAQLKQLLARIALERLNLRGHVAQRERDVFDLVLLRNDGSLGPRLAPAAVRCDTAFSGLYSAPRPLTVDEMRSGCGTVVRPGLILSGNITLAAFSATLSKAVGAPVIDRTALTGAYALELSFPPERSGNSSRDLLSAIEEQLGLRLVKRRMMLPVFVVDRIERPRDN